jgi:hypothetical protein
MHGKEQKGLTSAVSARSVNHAMGVGKVRALQRVLYRCAKQDKDRRFHALYDKVARSDGPRRAPYGELSAPPIHAVRNLFAAIPAIWVTPGSQPHPEGRPKPAPRTSRAATARRKRSLAIAIS